MRIKIFPIHNMKPEQLSLIIEVEGEAEEAEADKEEDEEEAEEEDDLINKEISGNLLPLITLDDYFKFSKT